MKYGPYSALPVLALLSLSYTAGQATTPDFQSLYESQRWFDLRDAVQQANAPPFYSGVVACVFQEIDKAERHFGQVFRQSPRSEQAFAAHGLLASAYVRTGRYRKVLYHLEAMQATKPDFEGLRSAISLFATLSRYPQPKVAARRVSRVQLTGDMSIPLTANGKPALYGFDSGMDLSVMSESEAKRLQLAVHDAGGAKFQDGASGRRAGIRFVVVDRISVGVFMLRNVTFLVVPSEQPPFSDLPASKQGILGFPVLLSFETVRWGVDRVLEIGSRSRTDRPRAANLTCPGNSGPVIAGQLGEARINVLLDTGSGKTVLTPRFANEFKELITKAKRQEEQLTGLAGTTKAEVMVVPEVKFRISGFELTLHPATVLPPDANVERDSYHVWLGMDLLAQPREVVMDFRKMTFTLR